MIRNGRQEGWLKLPVSELPAWALLCGVSLNDVDVSHRAGRGSSIISTTHRQNEDEAVLMSVPRDVILCKETVELHAKTDKQLREVLDAIGAFGMTSRGAILVFLLLQATHECPHISENIGVSHLLTNYVKFLPFEYLPTFWTDEELESLNGTSLENAMGAKTKSLTREFEQLRDATSKIAWCDKYWWNEDTGLLDFDDWKQVDAMYRSRALEFPGIGDAMVPCIDMANHRSGDHTVALYEADHDGNGLLLLRDQKELQVAEEITITYGDDKGASEMIFSYGFIEESMDSARTMFLDLDIPDDDPLKIAKKIVSNCAPGLRLSNIEDEFKWESDYVWIVCVNEEDGLLFRVTRTTDGQRKLQVTWKEEELDDTRNLRRHLEVDEMWDVFRLRAIMTILERVQRQITTLNSNSRAAADEKVEEGRDSGPHALAHRLQALELGLLEQARAHFETQKNELVESSTVQRYLAAMTMEAGVDEHSS